jgi:hypothetical protein
VHNNETSNRRNMNLMGMKYGFLICFHHGYMFFGKTKAKPFEF